MSETIVLAEAFVKSITIVGFRMRVLSLELGKSVRIALNLDCMSEGRSYGDYREMIVEADEYLAWGTDDSYLVELVKSKLSSIL
jgi:hypothetical protein